MAFERQTDDILTGSLNLNTPGDLVPKEDAIALHNWRVDASGSLKARRGSYDLNYTIPAGTVHSMFRWESHRYFGAGTTLYRVTGGGGAATSLAIGYSGQPMAFAAGWGTTFILDRTWTGRDNGTSFNASWLPVAPSAPGLAAVAGGALVVAVTYTYAVTYVTASGEETNAGEATVTITTAGTQTVTITRPATLDSRVTGWHVYRLGNTLTDYYRITRSPIAYATATLNDTGDDTGTVNYSDLEVERFGIALENDNDAPPLASGLLGPYYERLIAFSSAAHPNWYYWSKPNRPASWPGSALDEGNHAPVGEDGEELLAATMHGRSVRFYKERTIWRLSGSPDPDEGGVLEQTNPETGLIGRKAICSHGDLDYIQCKEGIYVSNGDLVRDVSGKIKPLFFGDAVAIGGEVVKPLHADYDYRSASVLANINGRIYFSYADITAVSAVPNTTLVLDLATGRWMSDSRGFRCLYYEGQYGEFLASASNMGAPKVWSIEFSDRSQEPSNHRGLVYQTGYRFQQTRDRQKTYSDLVITHSCKRGAAANRALTVLAYLDGGKTIVPLGSIVVATTTAGDSTLRTTLQFSDEKGLTARDCAIRIEGDCEFDVTVSSLDVHYYLEARDAKTFDSDETDFGDPYVKECSALLVDIDAGGEFSWSVYTDLPGGVMTVRDSGAHPATTGRQMVEIPLDGCEGRLVRVILETATSFRGPYSVRFRYRRIGTYRDGANNEVFETRAIAA